VKKTSNPSENSFSILYLILFLIIIPKAQAQNNGTLDSSKCARCIEQKLPEWVSFWKEFNCKFNVYNFYLIRQRYLKYETGLSWNSFQMSRTSDKSLCFFSPDSAKMADIYSYRYGIARKNGKVILKGGEPDSQIKLIDLVKDSIYMFLTSGTPTEYQDACWFDPSTLIVTGCGEIHELRVCRPFYYVLDFANNIVAFYNGNVTGDPKARNYIKYKYSITNE